MMYTQEELISKAKEYGQAKYFHTFPYGKFSFPSKAPVAYATALYRGIAQEHHLYLPDFDFQAAIDEIAKIEQDEARFGACIEEKTEGFASISGLSHSQVVNILSYLERSKYKLAILADAPVALSRCLTSTYNALIKNIDRPGPIHNDICIVYGFMDALGDNIAYAMNLVVFLLTKMKNLFFLEFEDGYAFYSTVTHAIGDSGCFCGFQNMTEDTDDVDDIECDGNCAGCSGRNICANSNYEDPQNGDSGNQQAPCCEDIDDDNDDELDEVETEVGERFSTFVAAELRKLPKEETDHIVDIVLYGMYTKLPLLSDRGTSLTDMLLITKDSVVKDVFLKFQMP